MTSPPDKLFRDGLGKYQKPAPPSAWNRVEANLDKKQPKLPWLFIRIAAGLLLVVALSITLWPKNEDSNDIASIEKATPLPKQKIEQPQSTHAEPAITMEEPVQEKQEPKAFVSQPIRKKEVLQKPKPQQEMAEVKQEKGIEQSITTKAEPEVLIAVMETTVTSEVAIAQPIQQVAAEMTRTNIAYSADQVNARFRKKVLSPDATAEKKSASGFMKVIDTALDFKSDGSLIGELRDRKNELLSFNGPSNSRDTNK